MWKLCFDQSYFWLVETIIRIRRKPFSKKKLSFCLVETVFSVNAISLLEETIIGIRRNQFWEKKLILASGQLIFRLVKTIYFLHFLETPASFFPSSGKALFREIVIFGLWKRSLELIIASTSRKKALNKRILFPIDRNSDSTSQNKGLVKKIWFN